MRESLCLFLCMLHFTDGCYVSDHGRVKEVTGYTGGSVLLPCSCADLQSTVKSFIWYCYRENLWTKVFEDDKHKGRLKLFNERSPANLSLLISDLKKTDEGHYRCETPLGSFIDIHLKVKGCDLDQNKQMIKVTGHSGESVVLPCTCTELQAKPEQLTWTFTPLNPRTNPEEIYPHEQSVRHTGRVKLLNETSPGNLSLQISNLNKEDQGDYRCSVSSQHINIRLSVQEIHKTTEPTQQTEKPTSQQSEDSSKNISVWVFFFTVIILLALLPVVLLLAVLPLIYWKCRGRRDVQKTTGDGQQLVCNQNEKQEEVTYSSVVHVKSASKPAHIQTNMAEHSVYASIK
ncbi:hypothetical protein Q8A67_000907 [Cirrhinus molitorella]|uniref:Ig-like domain-containing protein n=1 Tax=Cirrhinus molitorella TaxID=172907 RepID=A0AA88QG49_9TELE|nr:hypothetical protein Q8A67_000907 [Cirrhinus molitorella]